MHEVRREMSDAWAYGRATSRFREKITKLMVTFIFEDFKGSVGVVGNHQREYQDTVNSVAYRRRPTARHPNFSMNI